MMTEIILRYVTDLIPLRKLAARSILELRWLSSMGAALRHGIYDTRHRCRAIAGGTMLFRNARQRIC
jgi:hypothetical protein